MLINRDNWKDVQRYYQGTFVKFRGEDDKVFKITNVDPNQVVAQDSSGEQVYVDLSRPYNLDYVIPKKAVYQFGDNAAFLSRIPARMWRKGMDEKNTRIHTCTDIGTWQGVELKHATIEGFVNKPGYFDYVDARSQFLNGTSLKSAALSPRVLVTRKGQVFIDQVVVGRIEFDKNILSVKDIFSSDITPLFPNCKVKQV